MLKRKGKNTQAEWLEAWAHCEERVPHLAEKERLAIERLRQAVASHKKCVFGWSCGKDSLCLQLLIEKSGLDITPVMFYTPLQFPAIMEYIKKNKPRGLVMVLEDFGGYDWLNKNPDCLFTRNGSIKTWLSNKYRNQKRYFKEHGVDCYIVGRRIQDKNTCGRGFTLKAKGYDNVSPIADWTHEEVLAYIRKHGRDLPPCYYWTEGFSIGSGCWPERDAFDRTVEEMWADTWSIDKNVVKEASKHLASAREFLEKRAGNGD